MITKLGFGVDDSSRIKAAAKKMRVKVHPDRMNLAVKTEKEKTKIHEEATKVGQAADVLSNPRRVSSVPCKSEAY